MPFRSQMAAGHESSRYAGQQAAANYNTKTQTLEHDYIQKSMDSHLAQQHLLNNLYIYN